MLCIRLHHIFLPDAEEVMTEIWNCLEEYDIPTPRMAFTFEGRERVSMRIRFCEPLWAEIVGRRLSWWRADRAATAPVGGDSMCPPGELPSAEHAEAGRRHRQDSAFSYRHPTIAGRARPRLA